MRRIAHQARADYFATQGYCRVEPDFITPDERRQLTAWARRMAPHLRANRVDNRGGRAYNQVDRLPELPPLYDEVRLRLQRLLGLGENPQREAEFGWYLSIISDGGEVHSHLDTTPEGTRHLRCNLFLQLPIKGGRPVIDRTPFDVAPRTLLAFFPSEQRHRSEPVTGRRRRIILSFGYTVPMDYRLPG